MKKRLSSVVKCITGGDSCGVFAVLVAIAAVFVIWQMVSTFQTQVSDFVAFQQTSSLSR
jgi:hypothetical protein